jgi:large subunit ribosomal protein L4
MAQVQAALYSATGESKGKFDLPETIFGEPGSRRSLHDVIVGLQANQRSGTSSTKTRGLVSGGGRKPWKQKGTGNARSGSIRSPLWRKGGIIFGPLPRSYRTGLDQSRRSLALRTAFVEKANASEISILESLSVDQPKTQAASAIIEKTGISGRTLLIVDKKDSKMSRAFGNLKQVTLVDAAEINAWQLMATRHVLITKAALEALEKRWPKG